MATPGVNFILANSLQLAALLLFAGVIRYALETTLQLTVSDAFFFSVVLVSLPLFVVAESLRKEYVDNREAASLGADRLKSWDGKWPGNFDLVLMMLKKFEDEYPGFAMVTVVTYTLSFDTFACCPQLKLSQSESNITVQRSGCASSDAVRSSQSSQIISRPFWPRSSRILRKVTIIIFFKVLTHGSDVSLLPRHYRGRF